MLVQFLKSAYNYRSRLGHFSLNVAKLAFLRVTRPPKASEQLRSRNDTIGPAAAAATAAAAAADYLCLVICHFCILLRSLCSDDG